MGLISWILNMKHQFQVKELKIDCMMPQLSVLILLMILGSV